MQVQVMLNLLNQILSSPDDSIRKQAEHSIGELSHQPNYVFSLAQITTSNDTNIPLHLKQLAGVLLKSHVHNYWSLPEDDQQPTASTVVITNEERTVLKQNLPKILGHPSSKISTIVGMIIAEIAEHDFPDQWPDLITILIQQFESSIVNNQLKDSVLAHGSLKCLSLVAEHFSDRQVEFLFPKLFNYVMNIAANGSQIFSQMIRSKALSVASELIELLGMMKMEFEKEALGIINPLLPEILKVVLPIIVNQPVQSAEEDCSLKMISFKMLLKLCKYFSKQLTGNSNAMKSIIQALISSLVSQYELFLKSLVMTRDPVEQRYDSEGDSIAFDALIIQSLELLNTLVGKHMFTDFLSDANNSQNLLYLLIGYVQMTSEEEEMFESDPNQFVYDQEAFGIRSSALSTIDEMMRLHKKLIMGSLVQSAFKRLQESAQLLNQKNEFWWKPREACLSLLYSLSRYFTANSQANAPAFDIVGLLNSLLTNDLANNSPVYLKFRAIQLAAQYHKVQPMEMQNQFFVHYVSNLVNSPLPIRLFSSMAIGKYLHQQQKTQQPQQQQVAHQMLHPHVTTIIMGVCQLMKEASDDNIHIPLETLAALINFKPDSMSHIGKDIIALLLDLCAKFASDPTVPMDIINVFEKMAQSRSNYETLFSALVPQLANILSSNVVTTQQSLVEILIEVLTGILNKAIETDIPILLNACYLPIITLILDNDDPNLLLNGSDCLIAYVYASKEQLITHQFNNTADKRAPIQYLFQVIAKLLHPDLSDAGVSNVGGLITALFTQLGNQLQPQVTETIIKACINRLAIAEQLSVIQSIILVFAKLFHDHMDAVISLLNHYELKTKAGGDVTLNSLLLLLQKWVDYQLVFFGNYRLKVTALALVKLLLSGDQRLAKNIQIDEPDTGNTRRTRSKGPIKKVSIPFPVYAFVLIIEAYLRAKESRELEEKGDLDAYLYGSDSDADDDGEGVDFIDDGEMPEFEDYDDYAHLSHLVSTNHADDDDEDDIEDKFEKRDPLCQVNLEAVLPVSLREIIQKYPQIVPAAEPFLSDKQKKFLNQLLNK